MVIIKIKKIFSLFVSVAFMGSFSIQFVHGESFEQSIDETVVTDIQQTEVISSIETSEVIVPNESDYQEPDYQEPDYQEPDYQEPDYQEPDYQEPDYQEPDYQEPDYQEPVIEETNIDITTTQETTTFIQEAAFMYTVTNNEIVLVSCKTPALTKIDIPEIIDGYPVTTIAEEVFEQCYNVAEINIPYTIKVISEGAFKMCSNLQHIGVATENKYYKSVDGVLYNFEGSAVIAYPADKLDSSYSINEGVQYIANNCFSGCSNLESIILPETVSLIGYHAFDGCINLEELTVKNNVEITASMFESCQLKTIYGYENSKAETFAELYEIDFQSIGVLETQLTESTAEVSTEEVTITEEVTQVKETVTGESLVHYAPERETTDSTQKLVIAIIVVAMVSFVVAVASRSRKNYDDDDDDDDNDDDIDNDDQTDTDDE